MSTKTRLLCSGRTSGKLGVHLQDTEVNRTCGVWIRAAEISSSGMRPSMARVPGRDWGWGCMRRGTGRAGLFRDQDCQPQGCWLSEFQ